MEFNTQGTRTGRITSKGRARGNTPKGAKVVGSLNGQMLMADIIGNIAEVPPGMEIVGMHLGPRTKWEHPYSYDPILQFTTGEQADGSCYSDRLFGWYGYDVVRAKMQQHFGEQGDYWSQRKPKAVEAFLRDLLGRPGLKLTRIEEHCNVSNGFPCWYFAYQSGAETVERVDTPEKN